MTAPIILSCGYEDEQISIQIPTEDFLELKYSLFNGKIDSFMWHPQYYRLRKIADEAINHSYDVGIIAIACREFISIIEKSSLKYIKEWLDNFDNEEE